MDGLLAAVDNKAAAENIVALCLTERLNQGVVQVFIIFFLIYLFFQCLLCKCQVFFIFQEF